MPAKTRRQLEAILALACIIGFLAFFAYSMRLSRIEPKITAHTEAAGAEVTAFRVVRPGDMPDIAHLKSGHHYWLKGNTLADCTEHPELCADAGGAK